MRVILEVTKSKYKEQIGNQFVAERHEAFVVGRRQNERVQFRIPDDPYFSRYHMMIEINPPNCFLRDLGSRNGTKVNGAKIRETELRDGDTISGGRTEITVRIEDAQSNDVQPDPEQGLAEPSRPGGAGGVDMSTKVFDTFPHRQVGDPSHCALCNRLAGDTMLGDLTDTSILAYVCPECRRKDQCPQRPVPNYEKIAVLGHGALGAVLKARRISTGKTVVLKTISPAMAANPRAAKLFLRQMLLAARLKHPNIVPIVEMGQAGSELWLASEFVDGSDTAKLARDLGGTVPLGDAVNIVCQTLDALEYAHRQNLVHRDVKPSNILVSGSPGSYAAQLTDFGLLRNMDEAGVSGITLKGEVRGTVPFMPPEQVLDCRFVKPAGDIYAAGATLYWLLTRELTRNFDAQDARGEIRDPYWVILNDKTIPIRDRDSSIPQPIAKAIETALQFEPEDRFETAAAMAKALREAIGHP